MDSSISSRILQFLFLSSFRYGELGTLRVDPEFRGYGIGSHLYMSAMSKLCEMGLRPVGYFIKDDKIVDVMRNYSRFGVTFPLEADWVYFEPSR